MNTMKRTQRTIAALFIASATFAAAGCMTIAYDENGDPFVATAWSGPQTQTQFKQGANIVADVADNVGPLLAASGATGIAGIIGTVGLIARNMGRRGGKQEQAEIAQEKDNLWDQSELQAQNKLLMGMLAAQATKPVVEVPKDPA